MKIRIRGNSIRLRLTQSEVAEFAETGRVVERTAFAPGLRLTYALRAADEARAVVAQLGDNAVTVLVPRDLARTWSQSDEVAISGSQPVGGGERLTVVVEKDFQCLHGKDAPDPDAYPNPAASAPRSEAAVEPSP